MTEGGISSRHPEYSRWWDRLIQLENEYYDKFPERLVSSQQEVEKDDPPFSVIAWREALNTWLDEAMENPVEIVRRRHATLGATADIIDELLQTYAPRT